MENITAQNVELAIWRSGLVALKTRPYALEYKDNTKDFWIG